MMKRSGWASLWLAVLVCCGLCSLLLPSTNGAVQTDRKEIVRQARRAYYGLRNRGLIEFQSNVQPNWRLVLKDQLASDPANAETALKMLDGIHFTVSLGADDAVKVTHRADVAPPNEKAAAGENQIFAGMEQAMSGFFDSWKPFMLNSPFPDTDGEYQLAELDGQYHLTYKDGPADVATTMSKDFVISEISVDSPAFKSALKPRFSRSSQGLLLTGYDASYQGTADPGGVILNVQIDYREVSGLQLPHKLNLDGNYQGTPFTMELIFSGYNVKTR